jgi:hypothetical protein
MRALRPLAFAFVLAPGMALAQSAADPSFTLLNRASQPIRTFYATPAGRTNWGGDRLAGHALAPGGQSRLSIPADGNCIFDLRAVFADGRAEERRAVDTCRQRTVEIGAPAPQARGFHLFNHASRPIVTLEARPQGSDRWSEDRLPGGPLPPGGERDFSLPPGGACTFDLRVTFQGGERRQKLNADLCKTPEQAVQ